MVHEAVVRQVVTPVKDGNRFGVSGRTGRDIGCIACYNGNVYRPARAKSIMATHHGAFTACSRVCVLKARDLRTKQWRLGMGMPRPSEGAAHTNALESEEKAGQER